MSSRKISIFLNSFYALILLLFLHDVFTALEISNQFLKSFVYIGLPHASVILAICNLVLLKSMAARLIGMLLPALVIVILFLNVDLLQLLFATGAWETEVVEYEHLTSGEAIEYQLQDMGGLGYNNRTVKVTHLTGLFMIVSEVPRNIGENPEWVKVNRPVNPDWPRY